MKLLQAVLEDMASGRAVTIVPQNTELTTQQAADFWSRPFLVSNMLLRFKENINTHRRKVLDQLAAQGQELKMG